MEERIKKELTNQPITRGKKPTKKLVTKESDWKTYTGSCNQLNEDIEKIGKQDFKFEILCWCKNK